MSFEEPRMAETPISGRGESKDGLVRVVIGDSGLLDTVDINPRALRKGSEAIAGMIRDAVREAQTSWFRQRFGEEDRLPAIPERLQKELDELDAVYEHRMAQLHEIMADIRNLGDQNPRRNRKA